MTYTDTIRGGAKSIKVLDCLRDQIIQGLLAPGAKLPKRTELASLFQVSGITIQRVLNDLVADGFVTARRRQGTFVTDRPPHVYDYALVATAARLKRPDSLYIEAFERAAAEIQKNTPFRVSVFRYGDLNEKDTTFQRLARKIRHKALAGIVFPFNPYELVNTPVLDEPGLPRIAMMAGPCGELPRIEIDMDGWMDQAGQHLVKLGRRRVAVLAVGGEPEEVDSKADRLRKQGLIVPPVLVQMVSPAYPKWATLTAQLLMRGGPDERPDAMVIMDDNLVEHATMGLRASGVNIPGDLTVVAHANLPYTPKAMVPVTFLGFPIDTLLRRCMAHIDAQRAGQSPPSVSTLAAEFSSKPAVRVAAGAHPLSSGG